MNNMSFAWITGEKNIHIILDNESHISLDNINIKSDKSVEINIKSIQQNFNNIFIELDDHNLYSPSTNYLITLNDQTIHPYYSQDVLNNEFYYKEDDLGPVIKKDQLNIKVWSPPATSLNAIFFKNTDSTKEIAIVEFNYFKNGVWELIIDKSTLNIDSFDKVSYQLEITAYGEKKRAIDPYAKSMLKFSPSLESIGKAVAIDINKTRSDEFRNSKKNNKDLLKSDMEFIGYELHIRDFSIDPNLDIPNNIKGTYKGLEHGINHLEELGITHIQTLPIQECHTTDEAKKSYQDGSVPTHEINYNWGYDTFHFFIPEGFYCTNPNDPYLRISELKQMIMKLHNNNIGIIIDVVYNHIYNHETFENLAPGCYLRRNKQGYISEGTGAGSTIESRNLMTRKLIIDSLKYYKEEFHINGFRFDLMGFLDRDTIKEIRLQLGDDIILYGEGWEFTDLPKEEATTKTSFPANLKLGFFNDTTRNSYTGENEKRGFIQGEFHEGPKVRTGIIGGINNYPTDYYGSGHLSLFIDEYHYHLFANEPVNTINYLSIHDGFTLWDKINISTESDIKFKKRLMKMAMAMLLTSQGRVVIHGGDEMCRSKPLAPNDPNKHRAHTSNNVFTEHESKYLHENSYRSPDITNMFKWKNRDKFKKIFEYTKGLIKLRRMFPCLRYESSQDIKDGLRFIAENIPNSEKYSTRENTRYNCWDEVTSLYIEFTNGPKNTKMYLIGEVHKTPPESNTDEHNSIFINFDNHGHGKIYFNQSQVKNFNLEDWEDPHSLNFKLVYENTWDSLKGAYTDFGHNSISPRSIGRHKNMATIDLSIVNHIAGEQDLKHNCYIAYYLDCENLSSGCYDNYTGKYKKLLVIHNSESKYIDLKLPSLSAFKIKDILVDNKSAGTDPIIETSVKILYKTITIPGKTTTIIGCA